MSEEAVDHPKHYTSHPSGVECIQVTEHMNFNLGNAIKYIWRAGLKGKETKDLEKAIWYLQRELNRINEQATQSSAPNAGKSCAFCAPGADPWNDPWGPIAGERERVRRETVEAGKRGASPRRRMMRIGEVMLDPNGTEWNVGYADIKYQSNHSSKETARHYDGYKFLDGEPIK